LVSSLLIISSERAILNQEPLFNLTNLEFFNLSLESENLEWEKFIDEMLHLRFHYFRICFIEKNYELTSYFLNLLEGNFM